MTNKYRAQRTTVDGIRFASRMEARRYTQLWLMQRAGEILDLELQPEFPVEINGIRVFKYVADFRYVDRATGETIVEDTKGYKTPVYRLKKICVEAGYGIKILETTA